MDNASTAVFYATGAAVWTVLLVIVLGAAVERIALWLRRG